MTREQVNRAANRMDEYIRATVKDGMYAAAYELAMADKEYRDAWIRAMERLEYDDIDIGSRIWFIDDEDEYKAACEKLTEDYNRRMKFADILAEELRREWI